MAKRKKWNRGVGGTRPLQNHNDDEGTIRVRVLLCDYESTSRPGNITKSMTVRGARVSEVFEALEKALFG